MSEQGDDARAPGRWTDARARCLRALYPTAPTMGAVVAAINELPGPAVTLRMAHGYAGYLNLRRPALDMRVGPGSERAWERQEEAPETVVLPLPGPDGIVAVRMPTLMAWCRLHGASWFDGSDVDDLNRALRRRGMAPVVIDWTQPA